MRTRSHLKPLILSILPTTGIFFSSLYRIPLKTVMGDVFFFPQLDPVLLTRIRLLHALHFSNWCEALQLKSSFPCTTTPFTSLYPICIIERSIGDSMEDKRVAVADALARWLQEEVKYVPSGKYARIAPPTAQDLKALCRGGSIAFWDYVAHRVRSEKYVLSG